MDKALKQRMVGASVLIALAVVVLPMLLGGRPAGETSQTRKIELPARPPELSFETRRYPIGEQSPATQAKKAPSTSDEPVRQLPVPKSQVNKVDNPTADHSTPESTAGESGGDGQTSTPAVSKPVAEPPENSSDVGRYIVQVASFGALDNANRLSARLRSNGYSVMTDSVKSEVGILHRVRVGPYIAEAQAKTAVLDLESKISGIKPRVMDLKPDQSAQITSPSDPLVRWIVQVGSFSAADNADKLVASLRLDGLSAYQETVNSSGSNIYRVRIGPFLQREQAKRVEQQVRKKRSLNGVVMSAN